MSDIVVSVRGLGKQYRLARDAEPYARLSETLWSAIRHPRRRHETEDFWALRNVNFDVRRGEVVGIIGRNGAGKSTLLKILSRITEPTEGEVSLRGRVSSLLEVGTGFHPELTGRENIYLSGSILGMRRADIQRRFDEIVAFAEVERFLNTPVKRYSSGMQVRLGFAVAAHLEPEILVVDEVLAVGDASFQQKCLAKMENVAHGGRTVLFVSHNMAAVETLCSSGILLEGGNVAERGSASAVVATYLADVVTTGGGDLSGRLDRQGDGRIRFTAVEADVRTGRDSLIHLDFVAEPGISNIDVSLAAFTPRGEGAFYLATHLTGHGWNAVPQQGRITCYIPHCPLLPGRYSLNVYCTAGGQIADWVRDAVRFEVVEGDYFGTGRLPPAGYGSLATDHAWAIADR